MASRYKWFKISVPLGVDATFAKMMSNKFLPESQEGFVQIPEQLGSFSGRYIWRGEITATQFNESQIPQFQKYPTISFLDFLILTKNHSTFIRIKDPGRSISIFSSALERIAGFGFWMESVDVLGKARESVINKADFKKLISLKATNVIISDNVLGRVELVSKENIDANLLEKVIGAPHLLENCSYEVGYKTTKGLVSFWRNGIVKVSDSTASYVLDAVENSL